MQTFIPFSDVNRSAASLDRLRLGKQRVECLQILVALSQLRAGATKVTWGNHPAVRMWRNHERALFTYTTAVCLEWRSRGYRDTCLEKARALADTFNRHTDGFPVWWGSENVHGSHVAMLLRKDETHYRRAFLMSDELVQRTLADHPGYVWPA